MVGTNTHRLSEKTCMVTSQTDDIPSVIIPAQALCEVMRVMGDAEEIIVETDGIKIKISSPKASITSVLIAGNYPEYRKVIPTETTTMAKVNTDDFKKALERMSVIAKENKYYVTRLEFFEGNIHIISENAVIGTAEDNIATIQQTGEFLKIGFNIQYLLDVVKAIDGDEFTMEMTRNIAPCKITTDSDSNFIYVVTPVRLKEQKND